MTGTLLWTAAGVMALIALNGVYVATEFALIGSQRSKLEMLAREGRVRARRMLALLRDLPALDRAIATIQVGITCASLGLGMYGEHAVAELLRPAMVDLGWASGLAAHGLASIVAVVGLTFLHVVLGEVVPKSIALLNPARASLWLDPILRATRFIMWPVVVSLAGVSRAILRVARVKTAAASELVLSLGELETVIEDAESGGVLRARHAEILVNVLGFEELPVRKAMVPRNRVTGLPASATVESALATLRSTQHSRYPVYGRDLDDILGYIHAKDLLRTSDSKKTLGALARPVLRIPETAPSTRLLRLFRRRRRHVAVVLDEHGGTAGIVMPEDLMEEIFGEVQDEFDAEETEIQRLDATSARVRGDARLDAINEELGLSLDAPYVDTIGGLVITRLGRLAAADDRLQVGRVRLEVERVEGHAVRSVLISWGAPGSR